MRNLIISIFLLFVLVVTPKHTFAEPLSNDLPHIDVADIFYAPLFNDTGIFGAFGGYCGGDSVNQIVDWSIGNTIPHSSSMTDDIVFSTSVGHYMTPANWFERMRITKEGNVGIGMESPGQKLSVAGTIESTSGGIKFPDGTIQTTTGASGTFLKGGTGRVGYAWADDPSSSSYTPDTLYSFNSSGGGTTITRSATGVYQVTFTGLGGNGTEGGHVQVTSYGSGNSHCKVIAWDSTGADFEVIVGCFDGGAGAAADSQYDVQVIW